MKLRVFPIALYTIYRDFSLFALEDSDSLLGKGEILELLTAEYIRSKGKVIKIKID